MKICFVAAQGLVEELRRQVNDSAVIITSMDQPLEGYDMLGIAGTDRYILSVLHRVREFQGPVLTVGLGVGFLNSIDLPNLGKYMGDILEGNYYVEELMRLRVEVRGKELPEAVNEVALFPSRSAMTMDYSLYVNDEYLWHDVADGVIISTPTGSTAYAMSAGGPLIHSRAKVYEIVPVNSINLTRVPIVVPEDSVVLIEDISSKSRVQVIIDGITREWSGDSIKVSRGSSLRLVRLGNKTSTLGRYEKKILLSTDLGIPPSAKLVLKVLEYEGSLTQREIIDKTMLPSRTVRSALSLLLRRGLVRRASVLRGNKEVSVYVLNI